MFPRAALRPALVFLIALLMPLEVFAAMQHKVDAGTFAPLSAPSRGARIRIPNIPLTDGAPATLELERFDVWAPNAEIEVFG